MKIADEKPIYRTAIIGCGSRALEHIHPLKADPRLKVIALADSFVESANKFNATHELNVAVYTDYRELLKKEKPDIVVATLWPPLHLPVFRDCAAAGVRAVLSEKPMAPTWGECLEMAAIAETSGCLLTFCHQRRFAPGNRLVRQIIAEGKLGKIERMELYSPPHLLDCGTHTVDQAFSFNNETPIKWVHGAVDMTKTLDWFGVRAEGMATGLIIFANGVRATLQVGGDDMDLWGGVRVTGDLGFIEVLWDGEFKRAVLYSDPAWKPPITDAAYADPMTQVVRNAVDCLESGEEPELSYKKALKASEVLFALYESVRRNARVDLPFSGFTDNPLHTMMETGRFGDLNNKEKTGN